MPIRKAHTRSVKTKFGAKKTVQVKASSVKPQYAKKKPRKK